MITVPSLCLATRTAKGKIVSGRIVYLSGVAINVSEIARKTGISRPYVSQVLSGAQVPIVTKFQAIAKALGMDMDGLDKAIYNRRFSVE